LLPNADEPEPIRWSGCGLTLTTLEKEF